MIEHLNTLRLHLSNERCRLAAAKTPSEAQLRTVFVAQLEREIAGEVAFLAARGVVEAPSEDMSDDELLAALGG
jgi:hypothetical protein